MTHSRRHSPFVGHTTAASDKPWKQQVSRRLRRAVHQTLDQTGDGDAVPISRYAKGHGDRDAPKDGKQWISDPASKWLRK